MRKLGYHSNITPLIEAFKTEGGGISLVMPLAQCSLQHAKNTPITQVDFWRFTEQIASGLVHIHGVDLVHCDLKPDNILCFAGKNGTWTLQIGESKFDTFYACSRWYRAPEILLGADTARSSMDIWSLGAIVLEMLLQDLDGAVFEGDHGLDQLISIFTLCGLPERWELKAMAEGCKGDVSIVPEVVEALWKTWPAQECSREWNSLVGGGNVACPRGRHVVNLCLRYSPDWRASATDVSSKAREELDWLFSAHGMDLRSRS
eukprot:gnl/TRDRNA2_/TRDRNA2_164626_c0_seq1.p1 gnl/TRDRNA2_/TRDRNA2_164626_c0~~gnl/TRDRNA2_/TRDRNA2_164626_c0_seq1.p1  ORF type:complete len:261 (+),score=27.34 gnl/TRDRNA2_/TRDRNA2_164626_c0_seq1:617-1399(+)